MGGGGGDQDKGEYGLAGVLGEDSDAYKAILARNVRMLLNLQLLIAIYINQ